MKKNQFTSKVITLFIILITLSFSGMAQKDKESKDKVWEKQATSLAESYGLAGESAAKLNKAYVKIRQEMSDENQAESQEQLKKEIEKILTGEQASEAVLVLGSFNSRWDSYQKILLDFNLSEEKLSAASKSLTDYMKVYLKARKIAADAGDRFSGRTATELKSNLDNALAESLSESQMEEWNVATQRKTKSE